MASYRFYWEDQAGALENQEELGTIVSQTSSETVVKMYDNAGAIGNGGFDWVNLDQSQTLNWINGQQDNIILDMTNFDFRSQAETEFHLEREVCINYNTYYYDHNWFQGSSHLAQTQDVGEWLTKFGPDFKDGGTHVGIKYTDDADIHGNHHLSAFKILKDSGYSVTSLRPEADTIIRADGDQHYSTGAVKDNVEIILPEGYTFRLIADGAGYFPNRSYLIIYEPNDPTNPELTGQAIMWDFRVPDFATITVACFTDESRILTEGGVYRSISELHAGDLVETKDNGLQPIRWIDKTLVSYETLKQFPNRRPIIFRENALGFDHPEFKVSPQHKMFIYDEALREAIGCEEGLVPAKHLVNDNSILIDNSCDPVNYYHMMFEKHEIVCADDVWSESFYPGAYAVSHLEPHVKNKVMFHFPKLASYDVVDAYGPTAREVVKRRYVEFYLNPKE